LLICLRETWKLPVSIIIKNANHTDSESDPAGLVRRVLDSAKLSHHIIATQKGQAYKQTTKAAAKKKLHTQITSAVARVRAPDHQTEHVKDSKERKKLHQKANDKAKAQAITKAQKTAKADRKAKWTAAAAAAAVKAKKRPAKGTKGPTKGPAKGPAPGAQKTKLDKHEKGQVKSALRNAAHRMQATNGIPHRKDKFEVGGRTYSLPRPFLFHLKFTLPPLDTSTGKDVRKAVMNSYLHAPVPIGRGRENKLVRLLSSQFFLRSFSPQPKPFHNYAYDSSHPTLAGKHPINNPTGAKLHEYPATKQGQGWIGTSDIGSHRVLTSNTGGKDKFHGVIGHDTSRGGNHEDHYLATHTAHS
jgi:hypothetical protein